MFSYRIVSFETISFGTVPDENVQYELIWRQSRLTRG